MQRVGRVDEEREGADDGDLVDDQLLPGLDNYCFFMFMVRQVVRQLTEDNLKVVVCGMVFNFKLGHFGK